MATLEDSLGVRLLARTTRSVAPTEAGRRLLERLAPALAEIDQALGAALETKDRPAGILRISAPLVATQLMLAPRLGEFARLYPDITLDLRIDNAFTDIVAAGFDAGVRLGENLEADMIAVRLGGPQRGAVVGSPAYFEARPAPSHPRDLARHRCLRQRFPGGRLYRWEFEKNGQIVEIGVEGPLIANDNGILLEAALAGAGLVWLFEDYTRDFLAEGRLVRVLEDWCAPFEGFHLYYPSRRQMRPALRAFIDFYRHGTGTDR